MKAADTTTQMFPGILGELADATVSVTEAHPAAIALQFAIAFGNAVGRETYTYVGETRHGLNENLLIVGSTSIGRKGDSWNVARLPLEAADKDWAKLITSGLHSGEGLIAAVRDETRRIGRGKRKGEEIVDPGEPDKRLCVVESEFSQPLKLFRQERNILSNVIRDAWDGKRIIRQMVKNSPLRATDAHISIIGHTTPEDLRAYLSELDVANGTGNRFLFAAVERVRWIANPRRLPEGVRTQLAARVGELLQHAKDLGFISRTPEAAAMWEALYRELSTDRPGLIGTLLARGPAHVTRLSTLFALLDGASEVDTRHLLTASAWWDFNVQSIELIFAGRTGNSTADRIRAEILPGESFALSEIREQLFSNHVSSGDLRDALELLQRLGEVHLSTKDTGGRPAVVVERLDSAKGKDQAA